MSAAKPPLPDATDIAFALLGHYQCDRSGACVVPDLVAVVNSVGAALRAYGDARAAEAREWAAGRVQARRLAVLTDPDNPSWTEHFADLEVEIRRGPQP